MRFLSAAIFLSFAVSSFSVARAESLAPPCGIANLLAYQQMDGSCSVGILNFSGFGFSASGTGDALLDSASQILVTPATNGFNFSQVSHEPFTVDMGQTANYTINYNFVIDPAPVLDGAGMSLDPPFGNVTATQFYCNDGFFGESPAGAPSCTAGGSIVAPQSISVHNPGMLTAFVTFDPPAFHFGAIQTDIMLDGTAGPAGFDSVTGNAHVSNVAPEPASILLFLAGGIALIALRRRSILPQ